MAQRTVRVAVRLGAEKKTFVSIMEINGKLSLLFYRGFGKGGG